MASPLAFYAQRAPRLLYDFTATNALIAASRALVTKADEQGRRILDADQFKIFSRLLKQQDQLVSTAVIDDLEQRFPMHQTNYAVAFNFLMFVLATLLFPTKNSVKVVSRVIKHTDVGTGLCLACGAEATNPTTYFGTKSVCTNSSCGEILGKTRKEIAKDVSQSTTFVAEVRKTFPSLVREMVGFCIESQNREMLSMLNSCGVVSLEKAVTMVTDTGMRGAMKNCGRIVDILGDDDDKETYKDNIDEFKENYTLKIQRMEAAAAFAAGMGEMPDDVEMADESFDDDEEKIWLVPPPEVLRLEA